MRAEDDARARRNFNEFLDEDGPRSPKFLDDMAVMDDIPPDLDRRPLEIQFDIDDVDCPHYSGAEAPRA